jgi:hypothetical protein
MTLDYEHPPKNLTSYVKIKGSIALTINIKIGDADDQGIEFEQTVYNCSISEGVRITFHSRQYNKGKRNNF